MIGWTKQRKRCPEHGLVLRKRPGSYSSNAEYCPACGEKLVLVSVPYLFQVYFHPAIMLVPGILLLLFGLFFFLDVRGCVIEERRATAITKAEEQTLRDEVMATMPSEWKTIYAGMSGAYFESDRWNILTNYLESKPEEEKMPYLNNDQLRVFVDLVATGREDDAFAVITKRMKREP